MAPKSYTLKPYLHLSVALVLLGLISGCQLSYMTQSAYNHLKIMSQRKSIEKLLKNPDLPLDHRQKFELVIQIRPYIQALGLNVTNNYKTYVDLKRPYVSYLLTVAPPYSIEPMTWKFPFVGEFPYKGFHNQNRADREALSYSQKNYDTYIRGVSAYSTLGWFNDPLLSSMLQYTEAQLIETVIHESVHATVFIKNNVEFNEQLAVFVARKATLEYYKTQDAKAYEALLHTFADETLYFQFINKCLEQLTEFYQSKEHHTPEQKSRIFAKIQKQFKEDLLPQLQTSYFTKFSELTLNNAFFASQGVYFENQVHFENKFSEFQNIKDFIKFLKKEEKNLVEIFAAFQNPEPSSL